MRGVPHRQIISKAALQKPCPKVLWTKWYRMSDVSAFWMLSATWGGASESRVKLSPPESVKVLNGCSEALSPPCLRCVQYTRLCAPLKSASLSQDQMPPQLLPHRRLTYYGGRRTREQRLTRRSRYKRRTSGRWC